MVWWFGLVSLGGDMVYEGARSVYGPVLAALGASAAVVGLVTGAGEGVAIVLRLFFGPLADRTGAYWPLTVLGYAMTAVCVPLLAVTPWLGGAGLVAGAVLILLERTGKAVRSPSKSALLAYAARSVGRGRGFGVHKALDQVGAFAGPLLVAGVVAVAGSLWPGLAVLVLPGAVLLVLLAVLRRAVPDPTVYDDEAHPPREEERVGGLRGWLRRVIGAGLPGSFFAYAIAASLTTGGLVTFGIIGYHLATDHLVPLAAVPLVYAGAMLVEAVAALVVGTVYDRLGGAVLCSVPVLVAVVPALALRGTLWVALAGVLVWGAAYGVQDSTVKALVADLVDGPRRATAYGVFAGIQGAFAIGGGAAAGALYDYSLGWLIVAIAVAQVVALAILVATLRSVRRARAPRPAC